MSRALIRSVLKQGVLVATSILLLSGLAWSLGIRVNTTESIPLGVYQTVNDPISKGSYVIFCPPDNKLFSEAKARGYIGPGYCPGDYGYLMKKVLAAKNDVITVSNDGVSVNGLAVPLSKPLAADGGNRPLPLYRTKQYVLPDQALLLMSDVAGRSFDGRYFGPVDSKQIISVIHPILTW